MRCIVQSFIKRSVVTGGTLVVLLCGCGLAQSLAKAEMIDSFGIVPTGDFRGRLDNFLSTLANKPDARGLVVIYGNPTLITARRREIQNHIGSRKFDAKRITFSVGGSVSEFRSELWVIPRGAE